MYRISFIKRRLLINARPPIHTGWMHDCTLNNFRSLIHAGVICEGRGKYLKVATRMLWCLVSAYFMQMQMASGGRTTFQVGSCKTAQRGHEELVFSTEQETKGFA